MMSCLLFALGEHGAASEDLTQIVANGGVLSSGTLLACSHCEPAFPFASACMLLIHGDMML